MVINKGATELIFYVIVLQNIYAGLKEEGRFIRKQSTCGRSKEMSENSRQAASMQSMCFNVPCSGMFY